jgi:hydroxymethylbilane synthase
VVAALEERVPELKIELEIIRTTGDIVTDVPLSRVGDTGLFIKELENVLLQDRIDFAVHSMKDVPSQLPSGLILAATTERLDPRDMLITRGAGSIEELPRGGTLATGSLRRRSQVLALRSDLRVVDLRGNITTRLHKFGESGWDSMILASAGLERLGLSEHVSTPIPLEQMLPAVGQGALALQAREEDHEVVECLKTLNHIETESAVEAERSLLRRLEGGCQVPIGALGQISGDRLVMHAYVGMTDGSRHVRQTTEGNPNEARQLGLHLAEQMLKDGGTEILDATRSDTKESAPS